MSYTFNGYGEYVLIVIEDIDLEIQVRLAPFVDANGAQTRGTVFRGIATKKSLGVDSLQIELDRANLLDFYVNRNQFDILSVANENSLKLNGINLYFNENEYLVQFLTGVSIRLVLTSEKDAFYLFRCRKSLNLKRKVCLA